MDSNSPDQPQPTPEERAESTSAKSPPKVTRRNFLLGGAAALGTLFGLSKTKQADASPDPAAEHEKVYGDSGHEMAARPERVYSPDPAQKQEKVYMEPGEKMATGTEDIKIQDYPTRADRDIDGGAQKAADKELIRDENGVPAASETMLSAPTDPAVGPGMITETENPSLIPSSQDEVNKA